MDHTPRLALCTSSDHTEDGNGRRKYFVLYWRIFISYSRQPTEWRLLPYRETDRQNNARLRTDKLRNVKASTFSQLIYQAYNNNFKSSNSLSRLTYVQRGRQTNHCLIPYKTKRLFPLSQRRNCLGAQLAFCSMGRPVRDWYPEDKAAGAQKCPATSA
jgi:hypothetical protein